MNLWRWFLLCLFLPMAALAHGGVEKVVGASMVSLYQAPLSPLVGENVQMTFVLTDLSTKQSMAHVPVKVTVIDTVLGDADKDKVVLVQQYTTDENGIVNISHQFEKEGYSDVELDFRDTAGAPQVAGFLIQSRSRGTESFSGRQAIGWSCLGFAVALGGIWFLQRR